MQLIRSFLSYLKNQKYKPLSFVLAFSGTLLIYISFFQRNFISKTHLLCTLIAFVFIFLVSLKTNAFIKEKFINKVSASNFRLCFWSALLLSLLLLLNFNPLPFYPLEKDGSLQIEYTGPQSAGQPPVSLLYVRNQLGNVPYADLQISGDWREEEDRLLLETEGGFSLSWSGEATGLLEIGFSPATQEQMVNVVVNGVVHEINLQENPTGDYVVFRFENEPSMVSRVPFILSFIFLSTYLLLLLFGFLCTYQIPVAKEPESRKIEFWLGLPMLLTSVITLLAFWPGMLTNDSVNQWAEVVSGNFTDLNPILHTLLISALVKIVYSPAIVAAFQIIVFYLVLVYGFGRLRRRGISTPVLIALSLVFAFWPFNALMVNILWKDILYGLSLLLLFILLVEAALSNGKLFADKKNLLLLGISAFLVATIRHNGSPVAFISLAVLPLVYKPYRKGLLYTLFGLLLAWALVKGPLKSSISTTENDVNALNLTLLHHISAHLDAGDNFAPEQMQYLDDLLPISKWEYDCCYMGNIYTHPDFDSSLFMRNSSYNLQMAFTLFLQDPLIDIKDQLCASEMDWRFLNNQCVFKSLHPFDIKAGEIQSWIADNDFGLAENSLLPQIIPFYYTILDKVGVFSGVSTPLLRPAFYLFAALLILIGTGVRLRNMKVLVAALPVILQTGILALVNFAPAFRYQYAVCLIGLFCLGLLFLPDRE